MAMGEEDGKTGLKTARLKNAEGEKEAFPCCCCSGKLMAGACLQMHFKTTLTQSNLANAKIFSNLQRIAK